MPNFSKLKDVPANTRVLVRADFNVPLKKGKVADDKRIRASLPTIKALLKKKCAVILCSHLGRPKGVDKSLRMKPVAKHLEKLLGKKVGNNPKIGPGQVCLLENLRFNKGEQANNQGFARKLAALADVYVNDAFGSSHRAHASIVGVPKYLPSYAGLLLEKEISALSKALKPKRPFVLVIGGAKIKDKARFLKSLAKKADTVLVGSALAKVIRPSSKILLPDDYVVSDGKKLDIGQKTVKKYFKILKKAKTVVWNGPMGMFEKKPFDKGTRAIAKIIAGLKATTIIGGGDTVAAVNQFGLAKKFTHVSTGGGAALEFLEGKKLPGISALEASKKRRLKR